MLPANKVLPHKHYEADIIEGVVDGTINEENLCNKNYPCESTMRRWRQWAAELIRNAEGRLRSTAYMVYDLSYEFLKSEGSLLEELRRRIGNGWLTSAVRIYIDTGGI